MARPRRNANFRDRMDVLRREWADIRRELDDPDRPATSIRKDPLGSSPTPPSSPARIGKLPGESSEDYVARVLLGGDVEERHAAMGRQRAGRAATAARYGEDTGDFVSEWQFPDSSRVHAYQWDQALQQLRVRFIKYSTPWVYNDVPLETFQAFDAADSKGRFINAVLNNFPYRRASADEVGRFFQGV